MLPAHAGVSRSSTTEDVSHSWVTCSPHTRGSVAELGPHGDAWRHVGCSPHTRGSVVCTDSTAYASAKVLPAHAGVSRDLSRATRATTAGAPRTRGGQSAFSEIDVIGLSGLCSPHTRGSVGSSIVWMTCRSVLPAHAGVSRRTATPVLWADCAPRTRGGQSADSCRPSKLTWCSPHTRGSVVVGLRRAGRHDVLPAHAGVSRSAASAPRRCSGAPRTRGGQSVWAGNGTAEISCSPHTRGSVSRHNDFALSVRRCAPRTRGGQSTLALPAGGGTRCSPHTRGSVVRRVVHHRQQPVLPAHAGVSRPVSDSHTALLGAPRTRGGQSRRIVLHPRGVVCSPHTRGSVDGFHQRFRSLYVLPAHAGVSRTR